MPPKASEPFLLLKLKGLNQGLEPRAIGDTEFQSLDNFYHKLGELRMRTGMTKLTTVTAASENLYALQAYKPFSGTWIVLFGGATRIHASNAALTTISAVSGNTYVSSVLPWSMRQYNDSMYMCRSLVPRVVRTDGVTAYDAGLSAPSSAVTVAAGTGGVMDAGDYRVVVTFARADGDGNALAESNASAASATVTLAASGKITVTAIPTGPNQVNQRRLYVTLVNQALSSNYFLAVTVNDNVTTTETINLVQASLGDSLSTTNGVPPTNPLYLETWNERLWVTDGKDLFFSEDGLPESFGPFSTIGVNRNDGFTMNGIKAFGNRLVIGKSIGIYIVTGEDASTFQRIQISKRFGCVSHHSMQELDTTCIWLGGDNFYQTDGATVAAVGDTNVRDFVDGILPANYGTVTSCVDSRRGLYRCSAISDGTRKEAVYNFRENEWSTFSADANIGVPRSYGDFVDTNNQPILYGIPAADLTRMYTLNSGTLDGAYAITHTFRTKAFSFGDDDALKCMRFAQVLYNDTTATESMTFTLKRDDVTAALNTISVSPLGAYLWKRFSLPNIDNPGMFLDIACSYAGATKFVISGIGMEVVKLARRAPAA